MRFRNHLTGLEKRTRKRADGKDVSAWKAAIYTKDESGKRRQVWSEQHPTKTAAEEALTREIAKRSAVNWADVTLRQFAEDVFLVNPRLAPTTQRQYGQRLKKILSRHGDERLCDVADRKDDMWDLAEAMPSGGLALKSLFALAHKRGKIATNPLADWQPAYKEKRGRGFTRPRIISFDELASLVNASHQVHGTYGPVFAAMILVAAWTCVRPGELMALRWCDIDIDRWEADIERQVVRGGGFDQTKTGRMRRIIFPPAAYDALRLLDSPARRVDELLASRADELVFRTKDGVPFTHEVRGQYWRPVKAASGVKIRRFYDLRHWGASHLANQPGITPAKVALQLGHVDGGILAARTYIVLDEEAARDDLRRAFDRMYQEIEPIRPLRAVRAEDPDIDGDVNARADA